MQKVKTIQIGNRSFTLKELSVRQVRDLVGKEGEMSIVAQCHELIKQGCPELTDPEVLLDLYPSDIEELWQGFQEVNSTFLGVARLVGLDQALTGVMQHLRQALMEILKTSIDQFVPSLPPDTVPELGTTDSVSS